jgi:hypothetical protein
MTFQKLMRKSVVNAYAYTYNDEQKYWPNINGAAWRVSSRYKNGV